MIKSSVCVPMETLSAKCVASPIKYSVLVPLRNFGRWKNRNLRNSFTAFWKRQTSSSDIFDSEPTICAPSHPDLAYDCAVISTAGAITLKISYGYTVSETGADSFVALAGKTLEAFSLATT